ncbi:DUF6192 family protein [Streptomyces beijiangensis]|uniref:DUF6192 family protein n=1 Tax=Streptomyces beijiangensis TaxID=163361 RepID=UPI0027DBD2CB|nr:DUF6192 family protein [Streptomyces beijiangensis]
MTAHRRTGQPQPLRPDNVHERRARVRAACGWIDHAIVTGGVDMDAELARLLKEE